MLAQDSRFHEIPIAVIGEAPADFSNLLPNIDHVGGEPSRLVSRMIPLIRLRAFESRLKRMLKSLDADGVFDPDTGLLTRDSFWHELTRSVAEAADRSQALSIARYSFDGALDARTRLDGARAVTRLIRNIDFACRDDVTAALASDQDVEAIEQEAQEAKQAGIEGVPCFIFAGKFAVSGAQSPEYLAQAIERIASGEADAAE